MTEPGNSYRPENGPPEQSETPESVFGQAQDVARDLVDGGAAPGAVEMAADILAGTDFAAEIIESNPNILDKKEWHEAVEQAVQEAIAHGETVSILLIDLDFFKFLNDSLGHHRGDEAIAGTRDLVGSVSEQLRTQVEPGQDREPDLITISDEQPAEPLNIQHGAIDSQGGHIGGDEFGVLCRTDAAGARIVAKRLSDHFEAYLDRPENADMKRTGVGMSIGAATSTPQTASATELLQEADRAMYRNKLARLRPLSTDEQRQFDEAIALLGRANVRPRDIEKYLKKTRADEEGSFS